VFDVVLFFENCPIEHWLVFSFVIASLEKGLDISLGRLVRDNSPAVEIADSAFIYEKNRD
jgi:hypothetical protein